MKESTPIKVATVKFSLAHIGFSKVGFVHNTFDHLDLFQAQPGEVRIIKDAVVKVHLRINVRPNGYGFGPINSNDFRVSTFDTVQRTVEKLSDTQVAVQERARNERTLYKGTLHKGASFKDTVGKPHTSEDLLNMDKAPECNAFVFLFVRKMHRLFK